jgi:hypothetical protein
LADATLAAKIARQPAAAAACRSRSRLTSQAAAANAGTTSSRLYAFESLANTQSAARARTPARRRQLGRSPYSIAAATSRASSDSVTDSLSPIRSHSETSMLRLNASTIATTAGRSQRVRTNRAATTASTDQATTEISHWSLSALCRSRPASRYRSDAVGGLGPAHQSELHGGLAAMPMYEAVSG